MNNSTIHRLEELRESKGLSFKDLEEKIGFAEKGFSEALKKSRSVKDEVIRNTLNSFPEISMRWLLFGSGEMLSKDEMTVDNCIEFLADNLDEAIKRKEFHRLTAAGKDRKDLLEIKERLDRLESEAKQ